MTERTNNQFSIISELFEECFDSSGETDYSLPVNSLIRWLSANSEAIESLKHERSEDDSETIDRLWTELNTLVYSDPQETCDGELNQWLQSISGENVIVPATLRTQSDYDLHSDWFGCASGAWGDIEKVFPDWEG